MTPFVTNFILKYGKRPDSSNSSESFNVLDLFLRSVCRGESRNEKYKSIVIVYEPHIQRVYLHFTAENMQLKILQGITVSYYYLEDKSFKYATNDGTKKQH